MQGPDTRGRHRARDLKDEVQKHRIGNTRNSESDIAVSEGLDERLVHKTELPSMSSSPAIQGRVH